MYGLLVKFVFLTKCDNANLIGFIRITMWKRISSWKSGIDSVILRASFGEVSEWSKETVLKTVVGRPTVGSNPTLSAIQIKEGAFMAPLLFVRCGWP